MDRRRAVSDRALDRGRDWRRPGRGHWLPRLPAAPGRWTGCSLGRSSVSRRLSVAVVDDTNSIYEVWGANKGVHNSKRDKLRLINKKKLQNRIKKFFLIIHKKKKEDNLIFQIICIISLI